MPSDASLFSEALQKIDILGEAGIRQNECERSKQGGFRSCCQSSSEPRLLYGRVLGGLQVALRQDVLESVPLLCQLPDSHLQLVVLVLQLLGPLLSQQDPPAGLVPALPHRNVVPLPALPVLRAVLVDAALAAGGGAQRWQQEG